MITKSVKILFYTCVLLLTINSYAQSNTNEQHINVSMRMIGHQVLLAFGDSTSRVLPIEKDSNRYKISFESEFEFVPDDLIDIIADVVENTKIASSYLVEVEKCETNQIVYNFEIGDVDNLVVLPCKLRALPKDCYFVFFTILESSEIQNLSESNSVNYFMIVLLVVLALIIVLLVLFLRKSKPELIKTDSDIINIGDYQFNHKQMELHYDSGKEELTSKEADLLFLLYSSANNVIERDVILQNVWGDEGDYVGRTLDVFISKLRKKFVEDDSVKIVNVRGVGYKLVIG